MQLTHYNTRFSGTHHEIVLLCDGVNSPANMGSLLRIADSFGVQQIIFGNAPVNLESPRLKRTARSAQHWIPITHQIDTYKAFDMYTEKGYTPIALEITQRSVPLQQINYKAMRKILLVIGNEKGGISESILNLCKLQAHISMFGKNSSMNVSQATAIACYEITKQIGND